MLPRSQSNPSGVENFRSERESVVRKKGPPRPPPPKVAPNSQFQSSRLANDVKSYNSGRSMSISNPVGISRPKGSDLISFDSPPSSPAKSNILQKNLNIGMGGSDEFMYRIGASIFYIKSPLKNSSSIQDHHHHHPFSPPRPSQFTTPVKPNISKRSESQITYNTATTISNFTQRNASIGTQGQHHGENIKSDNNSSNFSGNTSNGNTNAWNTNDSQRHYSNLPLTWDEPPKKVSPIIQSNKPQTAPKPTIIRPTPTTTIASIPPPTRNYYDEPPREQEESENDFDDDQEVIDSAPMPMGPPPPPPELNDWLEGSNDKADEHSEPYGGDIAYAIALYDYMPEAEGDLALQAGDLVYLKKKIDESWLFGSCGDIEGIFPSNYVNVVVPLESFDSTNDPIETIAQSPTSGSKYLYATVLYEFKAETENDLNLEVGETVTLYGKINDEWLYGSKNRKQGQFPSAFVTPVPSDLPIIQLD